MNEASPDGVFVLFCPCFFSVTTCHTGVTCYMRLYLLQCCQGHAATRSHKTTRRDPYGIEGQTEGTARQGKSDAGGISKPDLRFPHAGIQMGIGRPLPESGQFSEAGNPVLRHPRGLDRGTKGKGHLQPLQYNQHRILRNLRGVCSGADPAYDLGDRRRGDSAQRLDRGGRLRILHRMGSSRDRGSYAV